MSTGSVVVLTIAIVILFVVSNWGWYRFGYKNGAQDILDQWKGWLNDSLLEEDLDG